MFSWYKKDPEETQDDNSKREDTDTDYDSDEDLYTSDSDSQEHSNLEIKVFKSYKNQLSGQISMIDLINIPCWAYNRSPDRQRILKLRREILETGYSVGVFTLVELDGKYYLIDGQHRQQALIKAVEHDDDLLEVPVFVICYHVEDDAEAVELFRKVNNTKPLEPKDTPNSIVVSVVSKLGKDFKDAIHFDKNKTVYPYLLAKDLQEKLRSICLEDITAEQLYKEIIKLNAKYSKMPVKSIPGVRSKLTKGAVEKARNSGFYLGLDEKWFWIIELEENLQF